MSISFGCTLIDTPNRITFMNIIAKVRYGSVLYGTSTPESDMDYRAIYLPPLSDLVLQRVRDAWEDKTEEDTSVFSLQHFARLAVEGQSIAIELLSAPDHHVVHTSALWETLRANRKRFYTKSMHSFLGYAKTMSGKYSVRVDRLHETAAILGVLATHMERFHEDRRLPEPRLAAIWDELPVSLNAEKTVNDRGSGADKRVYRVCGRELQATLHLSNALVVVRGIYDSYGERVRKVRDGNVEWKALMHAFRAALQCREIVETGDLRFPLADAPWLLSLRLGQLGFVEEGLDQRLDSLIADVQTKMDASALPDKADKDWMDRFILNAYSISS